MPQNFITLAISLLLYLIIIVFALLSILGIYIVTKYGRTPTLTVLISLIFAGIFVLITIASLTTLSQLPS